MTSIELENKVISYILRVSKKVIESIKSEGQKVQSRCRRKKITSLKSSTVSRLHYETHRKKSLEFAIERVAHWNQFYGFDYQKISVKNQKTRWGSCSKKGNLSFNYKIAFLPTAFADYIIVHELCHLKAFNHSQNFWGLVIQTTPQHKEIRKKLKQMSLHSVL